MISKIFRILLSRFKKVKEDNFISERRHICKSCPYNSNNNKGKISFKVRVIIFFSNLYNDLIGNKEQEDLGNCTKCGCDIFCKTQEEDEKCPKNLWKR